MRGAPGDRGPFRCPALMAPRRRAPERVTARGAPPAATRRGSVPAVPLLPAYPHHMKLGFKTAPQRTDWPTLDAIWALPARSTSSTPPGPSTTSTRSTAMARASRVDHPRPPRPSRPGQAARHLVLANPYRHPGLLAKMATAMDHAHQTAASCWGLALGWHEPETTASGSRSSRPGAACASSRRALQVIRALFRTVPAAWRQPGARRATRPAARRFGRAAVPAHHARNDPPPLTRGGPPIWSARRRSGSGCARGDLMRRLEFLRRDDGRVRHASSRPWTGRARSPGATARR